MARRKPKDYENNPELSNVSKTALQLLKYIFGKIQKYIWVGEKKSPLKETLDCKNLRSWLECKNLRFWFP